MHDPPTKKPQSLRESRMLEQGQRLICASDNYFSWLQLKQPSRLSIQALAHSITQRAWHAWGRLRGGGGEKDCIVFCLPSGVQDQIQRVEPIKFS